MAAAAYVAVDWSTHIPFPLKLNLGAGNRRPRAGYTTLDADPNVGARIVCRVPPIPLPDESCETVYSSHMVEHLTKDVAVELFGEIWRVLVVGGTMEITVPYALSNGAFQDPDHRSYWTIESFLYHTPHFAYLGRSYEQRFQMVVGDLTDGDVRVLMRKTATMDDRCECPLCEYGRGLLAEKDGNEDQQWALAHVGRKLLWTCAVVARSEIAHISKMETRFGHKRYQSLCGRELYEGEPPSKAEDVCLRCAKLVRQYAHLGIQIGDSNATAESE